MMRRLLLLVLFVALAGGAWSGQRVEVAPAPDLTDHAQIVRKGIEQALALEIQAQLPAPLPPSRLAAVSRLLLAEQGALILGHSELPMASAAANGTVCLDVHVDSNGVRARLAELGVLFTASSFRPYVLRLVDVDTSRTRRLGPLQELSGLRPIAAAGPETPVLQLKQDPPGFWTGRLEHGVWNETRTAKTLEEIWFSLWKDYFSRAEGHLGDGALTVRVAGWLSSSGPMEFDRLMDGWTREIEQKALTGVAMDPDGLAGVWKIRVRQKEAFMGRLRDAAKAQGLAVKIE